MMKAKLRPSSLFITCLVLAGQFSSLLSYSSDEQPLDDGQIYDFIVVGGGTGGCAVAARLAESGQHTVLLIEAGGIPIPELEIPTLAPQYTADPRVVKIYPTVSQRNAALANNGVVNFTIGQMLGGGSGINGMWLNRGSPHDYDNWAQLTSDPSWSYANLLKYFRKYENYTGDYLSDQRGISGPITVSRPDYAPGLAEWLQGGRELGYRVAEPNGPQMMSFAPIDFAHKNGRRVSSYYGYIQPLLQNSRTSPSHSQRQSNLQILTHTEANRIIFDGSKAVGVKFTSNSSHIGYARARKEIIVSAGVMDSPALLLRSGVGPKSVLDRARVPPVKYLQVGQNLHDHVAVFFPVIISNTSAAFIPSRDLNPASWRMFNEIGDGPYTSYLGSGGQAFLTSSALSPYEKALEWPDIHLLPLMADSGGQFSAAGAGGGNGGEVGEWETAYSWSSIVVRPKSRGSVTLDPRNIDNAPVIDFQYLTHPDDMQAILDGFKVYAQLCEKTKAFRRIGCRVASTPLPACSHLKFRSDSYWRCVVRQTSSTGLHAGGTCRMGRGKSDPSAVVDSKLRVIGLEGLRVADASVMPAVINANTQGAVYAIAEKAAEMILKSWEEGTHGWGRTQAEE